MNCVIKGHLILKRDDRKMTILCHFRSFSYKSVVKFYMVKNWEPQLTKLYPNLCYGEVFYALYLFCQGQYNS